MIHSRINMELNDKLITELRSAEIFKDFDDDNIRKVATHMEHVSLAEGEVLFRQGDPANDVYLLTAGCLSIVVNQLGEENVEITQLRDGKFLGELNFWEAGNRVASAIAIQNSELFKLPNPILRTVTDNNPVLQQQLNNLALQRTRLMELTLIIIRIFGQQNGTELLKFANQMKWHHLKQGEYLFREGEPGVSLFFVVSGYLKAVKEISRKNRKILSELKRGDCIGELAMLSQKPRSASVYAVRDSDIVELPQQVFDVIIQQKPDILKTITNTVIDRLRKSDQADDGNRSVLNIAVIPASLDIAATDFTQRLVAALSVFSPTKHWNSPQFDQLLQMPGISQTAKDSLVNSRVSQFLDEQEFLYQVNVFQVDPSASNWTKRCIERVDKILIVADSSVAPSLGEIHSILCSNNTTREIDRILVLVHPNGACAPSGTNRWLENEVIQQHHHIRWDNDDDFKRLARFISGRTIGLVLSGGGARGFAHIGVIRALKEAGIPIDIITGTSIGALMAAQLAMNWDFQTMVQKTQTAFIDGNPLNDYTIPVISLMRGKKLDKYLHIAFENTAIEDLWVNYFCISTNLSTSETVIHRNGPLWEAIRASLAIPGVLPPVIKDNQLLIDGGVVNNMPGDVLHRIYGGFVIAVDVSTDNTLTLNQPNFPSPWQILWSRICPFIRPITAPNAIDILMSTTLLNSEKKKGLVKKSIAHLYLPVPVSDFDLLDFKSLDIIVNTGYHYAKKQIDGSIAWALKQRAAV